MPSLPDESQSDVGLLRTYLQSVLPGSGMTDATVDPAYQPLLLLQTKHVMAAFAFSNGEIRKSYNILYRSFKNYYAEQGERWSAFDLAFVFCVQPDVPNLDRFCSSVETDVYFCRKFVIPLAQPLGRSLARLPFLPLTPLDGIPPRPPSAQTFLQQCGVPAVLARYLVVQHERGPERIVEDCLSGEFAEPKTLTPVVTAKVGQSDRATVPVRLETVAIENFRAYRKPQSFGIGTDVTVLYGPNGFGKTSFFDAIDFAVTGGIGRLEPYNDARFEKIAQHLDSGSEESLVSVSFRHNEATRKVTRSVRSRKQASLDGRRTDRKSILIELTGSPHADRVDNLISLFRATHLFSQEQQELTRDFRDDCRLREEIVSRMLAFEDYANAVNKAMKVRDNLQAAIGSANQEIKELSKEIAEEKKELERLGKTAKAHTNVEALNAEGAALRGKLLDLGITVVSEELDAVVVRGWRASLEARYAESQSRNARLSILAKETIALPRMLIELAGLKRQLAQKEHALGAADEKRIGEELALQRSEQWLTEIAAKRSEAQTRVGLLEWVRTTQPRYAQLLEKQRSLNAELNRMIAALEKHHVSEGRAAADVRTQEDLAAQAADKLATKRAELAAVQALEETTSAWHANQAQLAAVVESEQAALRSLESLRMEERDLLPQVTALSAEEARLSLQIAEVDKSQSELKKLLSRVQGHVRNGTCPLCGEDHGSKDELIRRIQKHADADAASGTRATLNGVRVRASQLAEQVAGNKQKQLTAGAQLSDLRNERGKLTAEVANFGKSAAKLDIVIDTSGPSLEEELQARRSHVRLEIAALYRQVQEARVAIQAAQTFLSDATNLVAATSAEMDGKKVTLARQEEEMNRLRNDQRLTQLSLDIEPAKLAELEGLNLQHLNGLNGEVAKAEADAAEKGLQLRARRQESTSLKAEIEGLRNQLGNLQSAVTGITARLGESKVPLETSEDTLNALIAEEARAQAHLLALRDSLANLELAIDTATTAAALTRLLQNVRNKEKAITTATRKRNQHQPWLEYFVELSKLVSTQQNEAIADFTREYGPRTSVIQRRLRSVYGFDEIEIQSQESTISVRIKRHGEELRPTDYFSQSQQQTLLLGLFLTACISQTWSAFSPVFLDDPVTHFDDLNTYAFLDLIIGLLESEFGRRQFVISTCDEKLLQLARQKFRYLGERARFYRFAAIGADGPVIEELSSP